MKPRFVIPVLVMCGVFGGCQTPTLPDPNDPKAVGTLAPDVLRNLLKGAATQFFSRVQSGEITDQEAQDFLASYANELLDSVKLENIPKDKAWEYAEVLITAKRWQQAEKFLVVAVESATAQDRRVNDSLRLARVQGMLGKVDSAIQVAKSVFNAPPADKAPILTAVYFEIVPAVEGKGKDMELARLLEDAIEQSYQTKVDPTTEAGMKYLAAQPFHVRYAWRKLISLYDNAGKPDLAAEAVKRSEKARPRNP
jgi:hypothetical protein